MKHPHNIRKPTKRILKQKDYSKDHTKAILCFWAIRQPSSKQSIQAKANVVEVEFGLRV